jgi:hypothetical protein
VQSEQVCIAEEIIMRATLILLFLLALVSPALATDGALEINQTCAVETGCFSGDTPGLPVRISAPGSYRLTSNLIVPDENTGGIVIVVSDVGIDLNEFSITSVACLNATPSEVCRPTSGSFNADGISVSAISYSLIRGVSVKDGSVTGMGGFGLRLGSQALVSNVRARWNRFTGIYLDSGSGSVQATVAYGNGVDGINVGSSATVSGSSSGFNLGSGIASGTGSTISDNSVFGNDVDGIQAGPGSAVSGNSVSWNDDDGIQVGDGSSIHRNTIRGNTGSLGEGIEAGDGCTVQENAITAVGSHGISTGVESVISKNSVSGSGGAGILASTSTTVIGNSINSNALDGIQTGNASTVRENTVNSNGADGIEAGSGSNVLGNTARSNGGFGLRAESTLVGFSQNVFGNNNGGPASPQTSSGTNLGGNQCDTSTTCP